MIDRYKQAYSKGYDEAVGVERLLHEKEMLVLQQRIAFLEALVESAREYVKHTPDCYEHLIDGDPCSCGLDAWLAKVEKPEGE